MAKPLVEIHGAKETRAALRKAGSKAGQTAMRKANQDVGKLVGDKAKGKAAGGTQQQRKAAPRAIRGSGSVREAFVEIRNLGSMGYGLAAFMGAKRRTGWYARARYQGGPPQFEPWVGNQHQAGARTIGLQVYPYHVGPAISENLNKVEELYQEAVMRQFAALGLPPQ
jgi:hypothetical protein